MGRGRRGGRGRGGGGRGGNKRSRDTRESKQHWSVLDPEKDTARFRDYYVAQGVFEEKEWDDVRDTLLTQLPTTFRINPMSGDSEALLAALNSERGFGLRDKKFVFEDVVIVPPVPLPWYPDSMAWQMVVPKNGLKKCPEVQEFRQWLMEHDREGGLNRQEAVSMIPTVLLEVQPEHTCLDMCAAPGSKTSQLISDLHRVADPPGIVVANDADSKRAYMLTHQLRRLASPNVVVTTHDAQSFPTIHQFGQPDQKDAYGNVKSVPMYFDRVLCDVPCSGDGTLRKNQTLWKKWNENMGNQLHKLQLQIAVRGARLLKVGGTMVYSTCSLNPIENEAVVAELLRRSDGALEIVDVSNKLPGLKRRPGLHKWKVFDSQVKSYERAVDVPDGRIFDKTKKWQKGVYIRSSMFCPTPEEATAFHLERCVRVLPHDQDTGGFFITLLKKTKQSTFDIITDKSEEALEEQEESKDDATTPSAATDVNTQVQSKTEANSAVAMTDVGEAEKPAETPKAEASSSAAADQKEASLDLTTPLHGVIPGLNDSFCLISDEILANLRDFYGITEDILGAGLLFGRSSTPRKVYMLSRSISDCLLTRKNQKLHLVHAGAILFEKNSLTNNCPYRVVQDGVYLSLPLLLKAKSPQLICLKFHDFLKLLRDHHVKQPDFQDPEARAALLKAKTGCVVFLLRNPDGSLPDVSSPTSQALGVVACAGLLSVDAGMGKASLQREAEASPDDKTANIARVMVTKEDKQHLEGLMAIRNPALAADIRERRKADLQAAEDKAASKAATARSHEQKRRKRMENPGTATAAPAADADADVDADADADADAEPTAMAGVDAIEDKPDDPDGTENVDMA